MDFDSSKPLVADTDDVMSGSRPVTDLSRSSGSGLIVPVILSGGGGTRLWPYSTSERPKQFLPLVGETSLFQEALNRVRDRLQFAPPIVVTSERHAELCEAELESADGCMILEPCARNTAPAIAMAAALVEESYGLDALLLVMPSDHVIEDVPAFHTAISKAEPVARDRRLVTFGILPASPDTGYGYLQMGEEVAPGVNEVVRFVEKPSLEIAESLVAGGDHLWNAGIFLFHAGALAEEMSRVAPEIACCARDAIRSARREGMRVMPDAKALSDCPSESIDYAVMEHASNVAVVPMSPGWSDVGSWDALASISDPDFSSGPVTALDCNDCYIRSDGLEVAALGVRDLIIVASGNRILVLPRGRSQDVKRLLSSMESKAA